MSKDKAKNNGVAVLDAPQSETQTLLRINFDEIDSIPELEPVESEQSETSPSSENLEDSEEQVLSTVQTFEKTFGGDPLKDKWLAFGQKVKKRVDTVDDAIFYVGCGLDLANLAWDEHKLAPNSFDRAAIMKKGETVLRLCQVPESMVKPQELTHLFWVVKLDRSTPGAEGEARTFATDAIPEDWFGGNVTTGALRVLEKCVKRVSKNEEIDQWEYVPGYEDWARDKIKRLRAGELSIRQIERLYDAKKKQLADARKREKFAGLTADEIASVESAERNSTLQAKLAQLGTRALEVQKFAAEELKKGGAELKEFLANRGIIPPEKFITPQEYAAQMTPGDAKALVQALITLYPTQPDRMQVFKVLHNTCRAVVDQIKSAQASQAERKSA
jgi:hypothetical protein